MKRDYAQEVTNRIVADIEAGNLPWEKQWNKNGTACSSVPMNATTGKPYRGINTLMLWIAGQIIGSGDLRFMTFKQAKAAGGTILKGSKGFKVYFYKKIEIADENEQGEPETRNIPMLKEYTVFHVSQTDCCRNIKPASEIELPKLPADVDELIYSLQAHVIHGGDQPCYIPSVDRVHMPLPVQFTSPENYRAVMYHELTHWTGHDKRCNRQFGMAKGSKDYAREELVAELGAAFLCAEFGLPYRTMHAAYVGHYLKTLKNDKRAIFQAASKAQKAVDWMREKVMAAADTQAAA